MAMKSGKMGNMSFYIGPLNGGYLAEVQFGKSKDKHTNEFAQFHDAVKWVEQLQKEEMRKNEAERSKEDT